MIIFEKKWIILLIIFGLILLSNQPVEEKKEGWFGVGASTGGIIISVLLLLGGTVYPPAALLGVGTLILSMGGLAGGIADILKPDTVIPTWAFMMGGILLIFMFISNKKK